jgi:Xaa-Pro aminopeptidase
MKDLATAPRSAASTPVVPFQADQMDRLMDAAGIDVVLATSKHNVQYLLGGHRSGFFETMDAIGLSRYLPIVVYPKGGPHNAGFFGSAMETYDIENRPLWTPLVSIKGMRSADAIEGAIGHLRALGLTRGTIAVERAFLPMDAAASLAAVLPDGRIVDATELLERLRARKSPDELRMLREASERVVAAILATVAQHGAGTTKRALEDTLRREEVARGLAFDYALVTMGTSHNRAASDQAWREGELVSIDSGGNYHGYIGDLCRMAILGEPDVELIDLLAEIDAIQQAARRPIRAGTRGGDVFAAAEEVLRVSPNRAAIDFVAHGMGLISHEAPRLTSRGPVPYPATDADRPLESGMVLSIETTLKHRRGYIKLEDTLAVTETGYEAFGDSGRGWNRAGGG